MYIFKQTPLGASSTSSRVCPYYLYDQLIWNLGGMYIYAPSRWSEILREFRSLEGVDWSRGVKYVKIDEGEDIKVVVDPVIGIAI